MNFAGAGVPKIAVDGTRRLTLTFVLNQKQRTVFTL